MTNHADERLVPPSAEKKGARRARDVLASPPPEFPEDLGRELDQVIRAVQSGTF